MRRNRSNTRVTLSFLNLFALLWGALAFPLRAYGQAPPGKGKPVVISFGQPNIWSLDQAHYLLSQLRQQSLNFQAARLAELDPNEIHGNRLTFMRRIFELAGEFRQPVTSGSPTPTPTQPEFPEAGERVAQEDILSGSILSTLLANPEFQKRLASDPKLNAVTKLDNHIQLQYEIIARQLTLLRDEVHPDERLVFLELPQSVFTTDEKADNKMAQVWWQVDGFTEYDRKRDLREGIRMAEEKVRALRAEAGVGPGAPPDCEGRSTGENCGEKYGAKCKSVKELCYWSRSLNRLVGELAAEEDREKRRKVESLLQRGPRRLDEVRQLNAEQYRGVRQTSLAAAGTAEADYQKMRVRTVDVIPHQSSLNVNDVQETVKSSFLAASFSFLFGLGARTSFQKQRDQFEQFLHQELYASGFGKGDSLFGWTFGPLPGTKRIAPGLRTTYAALVVPENAESLTLSARGCFFHRKDNEPPEAMRQAEGSDWWDDNDRECGPVKHYRIAIPSGGGTQNFWVTGIQYVPHKAPGQRMVASIEGENFTTQVGVLINGVPLKHVVELTRKLPASSGNDGNSNCDAICGEYEVVDPNEISIAFELPDSFTGTPEITVIGPGRAISLNHLPLKVQPFGEPVFDRLSGGDTPYMFGDGPQVKIAEVKLFREGDDYVRGLLTGSKLNPSVSIYVNGEKLVSAADEGELNRGARHALFDPTGKLFRLRIAAKKSDEKLDVTVLDGDDTDAKTVANPFAEVKKPAALAVTEDNVLALDTEQGEMAVQLKGTGLEKVKLKVLSGASADSEITSQSAGEVIVRLVRPRVAVKIRLTNPATKEEVTRAIIRRPPPRSVTETRDVVAGRN